MRPATTSTSSPRGWGIELRGGGQAGVGRGRKELERKAAVQRASAARGGGAARGGYAPAPTPPPSSPLPASVAGYQVQQHPGYPARPAFPARPAAPRPTATAAEERPGWEDDPTKPRRIGLPKHGKSFVAGMFDCIVSLVIFSIAPAWIMSTAATSYG